MNLVRWTAFFEGDGNADSIFLSKAHRAADCGKPREGKWQHKTKEEAAGWINIPSTILLVYSSPTLPAPQWDDYGALLFSPPWARTKLVTPFDAPSPPAASVSVDPPLTAASTSRCYCLAILLNAATTTTTTYRVREGEEAHRDVKH